MIANERFGKYFYCNKFHKYIREKMFRSGRVLLFSPFFLPPVTVRATINSDTFIYRKFGKDKKKNKHKK